MKKIKLKRKKLNERRIIILFINTGVLLTKK